MRGLQDKVIVVAAGGLGASDGSSNSASIGGVTAVRFDEVRGPCRLGAAVPWAPPQP